ncbi:MAG: GNAT family N-acetyltransferase [Lachnospiraceae bacterium]|jgi:RimJ/RimL family protein N-acetyltransferase|nr:GNAT family N-acetyltransferase [Lachnospiraceae bacterium]
MLKGKITGLRAVEETDLEKLLEWRNRPEYRRFFREYRELGMVGQRKWFENVVLSDEHTRMFSIVELPGSELLGACGLCYIDWPNRCADFSIYIGKDDLYIDENYAADAARVMINYGFNELNLHRLWTEIYEIDEKKKVMFDTLGFTHEATHKETHWTDGKWVDSWYYSLLRADWIRNES